MGAWDGLAAAVAGLPWPVAASVLVLIVAAGAALGWQRERNRHEAEMAVLAQASTRGPLDPNEALRTLRQPARAHARIPSPRRRPPRRPMSTGSGPSSGAPDGSDPDAST